MTSLTLSLLPCLSSPNSSSMTCLEPTNPCSSSTTSVLEMLEGTRRTGTMKWKRTLLLEGNKEPPQGCQMGPGRGRNKMIWSSHGLSCDTCLTSDLRVAPGRLSSFSWSLHEISNLLSHQSSTHHSLSLSPTHSGRTSSLGWWLTSITSSWVALLSPMTTMRSSQSVEWNSNSESPSPSNRLRCPGTGLLHGESTLEQLHTCSHIGKRNLMHKGPEPYPYSLPLCPFPTLPLSTLTKVSMLVSAATSSSQTKMLLKTSSATGSPWLAPEAEYWWKHFKPSKKPGYCDNKLCHKQNAGECSKCVSECRHKHVCSTVGETTTWATASQSEGVLEPHTKCPWYTHGILWDEEDNTLSTTVQWSVTADLVPMVLTDEDDNLPTVEKINMHPQLFKITTTIKVVSGHMCTQGTQTTQSYWTIHTTQSSPKMSGT